MTPQQEPSAASLTQTSFPTSQSAIRNPQSELDLFCPSCNYNLRGIDSERCPECGEKLDYVKLTRSQLPWLWRDQLGVVRAYWKTVWMALRRQPRFWAELGRPVSFADSQRFRWATVWVVWVPLVLFTLAILCIESRQMFAANRPGVLLAFAIVLCAAWLFLAAITGLPSYFFHPKSIAIEAQNRAIALSYYCCAPLAFLPIVFALAFSLYCFLKLDLFRQNRWGQVTAFAVCIFVLTFPILYLPFHIAVSWLRALAGLHRRATQSEDVRSGLFYLLIPTLWLALGGLICIGIPLTVGYLILAIVSLLDW